MDADGHCSVITCVAKNPGTVRVGCALYHRGERLRQADVPRWRREALPPALLVFTDPGNESTPFFFAGVAASTADPAHGTCSVVVGGIARMYARFATEDDSHYPTVLLRFDSTDRRAAVSGVCAHTPRIRAVTSADDADSLVGVLQTYGDGVDGPHRVLLLVGFHHAAKLVAPPSSEGATASADPLTQLPLSHRITAAQLGRLRSTSLAGVLRGEIAQLVAHAADTGSSDLPLGDDQRERETQAAFEFRKQVRTDIAAQCLDDRWKRALTDCLSI